MLIGREAEMRVIARALSGARAGVSSVTAIVGEPGIGKTSLLRDARERAGAMAILEIRPTESESEIPFGSLLELLRPALGTLHQLAAHQRGVLESALALRPAAPGQERFAVGAALLSLLAAIAEHAPLLVVIDDAQWLDASSAQALRFAVRRLVADPVAVLIAAREGEPSLLDDAGVDALHLSGLTAAEAARLLPELDDRGIDRLLRMTAGNPLALLELRADDDQTDLTPDDAPIRVSSRIAEAFLRRSGGLSEATHAALLLVATCELAELGALSRAADALEIDLETLADAEAVGLVEIIEGTVRFTHPLARAAVYGTAPADRRRAVHRAVADALPDRDADRRAWHLAASAVGADVDASIALEHAARRARSRSAYAAAAAAYARAGALADSDSSRARLLHHSAQTAWEGGLADQATAALREARRLTGSDGPQGELDALEGRIALRRGPLMHGWSLLTGAAAATSGDRAVELYAEASAACFYAGRPALMVQTADQALAALGLTPSVRSRFLAGTAAGMAAVVGGDAAAGARRIAEAVSLARRTAALLDEPQLLGWIALGPLFLRGDEGRELLTAALERAREAAALDTLPYILNLIALDQATSDHWTLADATYGESIALARETRQDTQLTFGLAALAWLDARRGREERCRAGAAEALTLAQRTGARLHEVWATAALGELALGRGEIEPAIELLERQQALLDELEISDPDLSPAPDLVEAHLRERREAEAIALTRSFGHLARAKGQPWSLARALRCEALTADDARAPELFERALAQHAQTPDSFETARTQIAYGERLRRARQRVRAREQLRAAAATLETLGAEPTLARARAELAATGERPRPRDPRLRDELTPQELQIAQLLAAGRTTRQAAATVFLSPKTVEYHLRHVYQKLGINRREQLAGALEQLTRQGESTGSVSE